MDDENPVVRRGMVASLLTEQIPVIGESAMLRPAPVFDRVDVIVVDADTAELRSLVDACEARSVRWIATVRQPTGLRLRTLADDGAAAILLMAEITPDTLVHAVRSAVRDRTTMSHLVLMRLLEHAARYSAEGGSALTAREQHVLRLLAEGEETRSIAEELHYSERTVKNVVHDVLTKLNSRTRAQAVGVAMRRGIL